MPVQLEEAAAVSVVGFVGVSYFGLVAECFFEVLGASWSRLIITFQILMWLIVTVVLQDHVALFDNHVTLLNGHFGTHVFTGFALVFVSTAHFAD